MAATTNTPENDQSGLGLGRYLGKFGSSLNVRLTVLFILVALVPMVAIATLSIQKASSALQTSAWRRSPRKMSRPKTTC